MLKYIYEPRNWILSFAFLCTLIFALPEVMLLSMATFGIVLLLRQKSNSSLISSTVSSREMWLVPLCFSSVFIIKLLSSTWAFLPNQSIGNAFNSLHFLLWPALVIYFRKANITVRETEPWVAASMLVLMFWYLVASLFFPVSENAQCFKAGGHNCGLLGQVIAFMLLWLFIAITRVSSMGLYRWFFIVSFGAGWIALLGTIRRTEILGLLLGMLVVLVWRLNQILSIKKMIINSIIFIVVLLFSFLIMKPKLAMMKDEVIMYFQGGQARVQVLDTSVGARLDMYRIALAAIQERPLLGWGAGLKPVNVPQFSTDPTKPYGYSNFHQQYLQIILEVGLLGAFLASAIVIYIFRSMVLMPWRRGDSDAAAIAAALFFTYAWKALGNGALNYSVTNNVFVFFTALIWAQFTRSASTGQLNRLE